MNRAQKGLIVLVVATLGIWGCAQGPAANTASVERIKILEAKNAKLEEDFRAVASTRDQLRKKLATLEEQNNQLTHEVEQLTLVGRERDELTQQVKSRTAERDMVQLQLETLRKGIREILGQVDAAVSVPAEPTLPSTATLSIN